MGVRPDPGGVRSRGDGEAPGWPPPLVRALQDGDHAGFDERVRARAPAGPRDVLDFDEQAPIPLDEVEPAEEIRRRFISSAMSLGALSPEAHETLAIAMNRMHARSNSGEGGEDPTTYATRGDGERADNRIKQVASGRFGVTTAYLVRADELEIKIAQGSKPGEGGQLPGHKVTDLIARLRHAVVGIPLISPPPHHDIYSIEDLAQLIHDLKQVNPAARVGVKLVAEAGVGTVAAGVAKAYADYVLISGYNGGTGASPPSSIKHARTPWGLGLAETQAILMRNKLRERLQGRGDGGLRTRRDVVIAPLFRAGALGFGNATGLSAAGAGRWKRRGRAPPGVFALGNPPPPGGGGRGGRSARVYGGAGPDQPLRLRFRGSAGQSFGAFTLPRMHLHLEGEANDHVGKGLCGGEIVIRPFRGAGYTTGVLIGNTALYGATSGHRFAAGGPGDRFAARHSGAVAVIEGAGDHCCEYMTRGVVVGLGPIGRNFAAGMSNGIAYVLDERGQLESHCNLEMVAVGGLNSMDE